MKLLLANLCLILGAAAGSAGTSAGDRRFDFVEEVIEISILELTSIDWQPGKKVPKKIANLDGKKVRIKGFMAIDTPEGTSSFRLTYDQCGCSNAKASHFVEVDLGDETTGYDPDERTVEGVFSVGEVTEDGFVTSLFRLKADRFE